jgi:polar amino acid transport system permease protein
MGHSAGLRGVLIATVSTVVVFTVLAVVIVRSSGWDRVREGFFSGDQFRVSLGPVSDAFLLNVKMFLIAEAIVLVAALLIATVRSLKGPVFFPLRLMAIAFVDFFRGIPVILLVLILGLGVPGLQIEGVPKSELFWGVTALVLIYTAFAAEVYRAGIESVHPSQEAAARSLGLSRFRAMRHVVLPQAVRRVVPPLLNDFIGLQKDTALVSVIGLIEALRQAQIDASATFNFTPFVVASLLFLSITIPLTRIADWLIARDRRKWQAGGAV